MNLKVLCKNLFNIGDIVVVYQDIEDLPKALQSPLKPTAIIQKPNITQLLKEY